MTLHRQCARAGFLSGGLASIVCMGSSTALAALETDAWTTHITATTAVVRVVGNEDSCSAATLARFRLSLDGGAARAPSDCATLSGDHVVVTWDLSGLVANTSHRARVTYTNGASTATRDAYWTQAAPSSADIKFVLAGDTQGHRQYDLISAIWERAGRPNYLRDVYRFLLHTGDFANYETGDCGSDGGNEEWFVDKMLDYSNNNYVSLFGHLPFYVTPGGHDQFWGTNYAGNLTAFLKMWGGPRAVNSSFNWRTVGKGYSFKQGPVTFIVVNAMNLNGPGVHRVCATGAPGGQLQANPVPNPGAQSGGYASDGFAETRAWFESELSAAERDRKNRPFIVVSAHHNWSSGGWSDPDHAGIRTEAYRSTIKDLLAQYQVDAFFAGHTHNIEFGRLGANDPSGRDNWKTMQVISGAANSQDGGARDAWDTWNLADLPAHFDDADADRQIYFPHKYYDSSNAFVEVEARASGFLRFRTIAYREANPAAPNEPSMRQLLNGVEGNGTNFYSHAARVPRAIERNIGTGEWHLYGPYRVNQGSTAGATERFHHVQLAAQGEIGVFTKRLGKPGPGNWNCGWRLTDQSYFCNEDLSDASYYWIGVYGYTGGTYELTVSSRNSAAY